MSYKLAAASSDGKSIDQHFGRSEQFFIYEVNDNDLWEVVDVRKKASRHESAKHHDEELNKTIDLIKDCNKVLVSQIGNGAEQVLQAKGITVYTVSGNIDNAINKIIEFERKQKERKYRKEQ